MTIRHHLTSLFGLPPTRDTDNRTIAIFPLRNLFVGAAVGITVPPTYDIQILEAIPGIELASAAACQWDSESHWARHDSCEYSGYGLLPHYEAVEPADIDYEYISAPTHAQVLDHLREEFGSSLDRKYRVLLPQSATIEQASAAGHSSVPGSTPGTQACPQEDVDMEDASPAITPEHDFSDLPELTNLGHRDAGAFDPESIDFPTTICPSPLQSDTEDTQSANAAPLDQTAPNDDNCRKSANIDNSLRQPYLEKAEPEEDSRAHCPLPDIVGNRVLFMKPELAPDAIVYAKISGPEEWYDDWQEHLRSKGIYDY